MDIPVLGLTWEFVVQNGVDALALGSLYGLFALGIALIFGVMRLVNFAHGELIMIGGFSLYGLSGLPLGIRIVCVIAIVIAAALLMERFAFRPLRNAGPATLLVASFGISIGLQSVVFMIEGAIPRATLVSQSLSQSFFIGDIAISKLNIVILIVTIVLLTGLVLFLRRTSVGVRMRAAAEDFRVSRLLGVRANSVIALAFALSGLLAGVAAVLLVAQTGEVYTGMGLTPVLLAFVATIVGGMGSLLGAVVGAMALGGLTVALQVGLPLDLKPFRDAFVFGAVLLTLVIRPQGLIVSRAFAGPADRSDSGYTASWSSLFHGWRYRRAIDRTSRAFVTSASKPKLGWRERTSLWSTPALLVILVVAAVMLGTLGDATLDQAVLRGAIYVIVVVGLYLFTGLSGVFSFGHMSFALVGAYAASLLVMQPTIKQTLLPSLPGFLADSTIAWIPAVLIGGLVGAIFALIISVPIMRLSGLTASLATFAVLLIANVVGSNWHDFTGGFAGLAPVPVNTTKTSVLPWVVVAIILAFAFQQSRTGQRLRASREDEVAARSLGVKVARERGLAFVLSAFFVGVAGALQAQLLGLMTPELFYLQATFVTLTMLVVGGMTSLSGAVIGVIVVSAIQEALRRVENGVDLGPVTLDSPSGLAEVGLAVMIVLILVLRPEGLLGGRELRLPGGTKPNGPGETAATAVAAPGGVAMPGAQATVIQTADATVGTGGGSQAEQGGGSKTTAAGGSWLRARSREQPGQDGSKRGGDRR
jgi:branched-subunit amino acid ABC-type transport system permease component